MTDPMNSMVRRTFRLANFLDYLARRGFETGKIFPDDAAHGRVAGANHDRVMVIGEATATGYGIRTHQLGVAAQFARRLAARTGRGVEWSTVGIPGSRLRAGPRVAAAEASSLAKSDFVILIAGIVDTLALTRRATWARHLTATLVTLHDELPMDARILVTEIPPLNNLGAITAILRRATSFQARLLNETTRNVVATFPRCILVPFPSEVVQQMWRPELNTPSFPHVYAEWAQAMINAAFAEPMSAVEPALCVRTTDWIAAAGLRAVTATEPSAVLPTAALREANLSPTAIGICLELLAVPGQPTDPYESGLDKPDDVARAIEELVAGGYVVRVGAPSV